MNKITNVKIADKEYVVWKTQNEQFIVQDNICPHRLAPLSEGRIENDKLECAYHGWQFNKNGTCVTIPQSSKNFSCELGTYPTRKTGDILWANLNPSDISSNILWNNIQNDNILINCTIPYIREVPYSWNFLLENFMDPAHVPFAHDGLQSVRSDGCVIPIQLLEKTKYKLSFLFSDISRGKERVGRMEIYGPFVYKLFIRENNMWNSHLTILCIPIESGKSRVIMCNNYPSSVQDRIKLHGFSNAFFNTDDYLVHKQEINKIQQKSYFMPTSSDKAIKVLQKWLERYHPNWIYQNTRELTKKEATNNYQNHVHCIHGCWNVFTIWWNHSKTICKSWSK
jgi:phenylpropionate dioxygenase-like ring-hydroxylating dioxygenase large terminal subunit